MNIHSKAPMAEHTGRRRRLRGALSLALAALAGACTFDAENPMAITEDGLTNVPALTALVNGVVGDYDESYQRSALYAGLLSDEITASGSWTWWHDADDTGFMDVNAPTGDLMAIPHYWWRPLARARYLAEETYDRLQEHLDNPDQSELTAMTLLYAGMAYRDSGEYFCVAAYDNGPAVQPSESLGLAEDRFTKAIQVAQAAGVDSIAQMAYLMRARVRLSLGNNEAALSDARMVPDGFHWMAHFRNASGESNGFVQQINYRIEGTIQQEYHNWNDSRVPVVNTGKKGADNLTPRWDQLKLDRYGNMPMGDWQEARLIEAEVLLGRGEVANAVTLMNEVRAEAGLAALDTSMSASAATAALRVERQAEFFLEGMRMLDMRRWNLFPAGWQGDCSPLPLAETDNNPNL